jgi:hypothetical protein
LDILLQCLEQKFQTFHWETIRNIASCGGLMSKGCGLPSWAPRVCPSGMNIQIDFKVFCLQQRAANPTTNRLQTCVSQNRVTQKTPYTISVKLSDFTLWRHTWRKNWVNCAVLTSNNVGLRNVVSSRLSHRELSSSLRESHRFLSLPPDTTMASSEGTQRN